MSLSVLDAGQPEPCRFGGAVSEGEGEIFLGLGPLDLQKVVPDAARIRSDIAFPDS